jgi:hypothetical protein
LKSRGYDHGERYLCNTQLMGSPTSMYFSNIGIRHSMLLPSFLLLSLSLSPTLPL